MAKSKKQGGGGKKIGRKKRKLSFQRYKVVMRFLNKLKRHLKRFPGDLVAKKALARRDSCTSWVDWRTKERARKGAR